MNLNIQNVTPETVEIQGQSVNRAYAEGVMLTMLVATAGKNEPNIASIGRQYAEAGLSLEGSPAAYAAYIRADKAAALERTKQEAAAKAHADRFASYNPTALEVARSAAARRARDEKYRSMGAAIRSANGRSSFSSSDFD